jgi:hypothetical protein
MAARRQRGISGGGTINNQLKLSVATETEMAMMTVKTMTIKTKALAAVATAWRQRGGGGGKSQWRLRRQQLGGDGSMAAEMAAARQWRRRQQLGGDCCLSYAGFTKFYLFKYHTKRVEVITI